MYNFYMDMSPLAVSLFQIHFEIPNNIQTITVFLALEVAPVLYILEPRIKSNGQIIVSTKKKKRRSNKLHVDAL